MSVNNVVIIREQKYKIKGFLLQFFSEILFGDVSCEYDSVLVGCILCHKLFLEERGVLLWKALLYIYISSAELQ
jgi:hypothetical protein